MALDEIAALQASHHQASDPALRFLTLLRIALADGHAHVADRLGRRPHSPDHWGWRRNQAGRRWAPRGTRIGWIKERDLSAEPAATTRWPSKWPVRSDFQSARKRFAIGCKSTACSLVLTSAAR